jgi:hypothetical protein
MNAAPALFESKAGDARIAKKIDFLLLEASEAFLDQELGAAGGCGGSHSRWLEGPGISKRTTMPMRDQCVLFQPRQSSDGAFAPSTLFSVPFLASIAGLRLLL